MYDSFVDKEKKISRFLSSIDCGIGLQNVFWIFLLTPIVQPKGQITVHCDQQIWLRAGKIISQLTLKTASYRNQISFWTKGKALAIGSAQILGMQIREYGSNFEVFSSYVDSAERHTVQLKNNPILRSVFEYNNKMICTFFSHESKITLVKEFNNNCALGQHLITVLEKCQISYDEIITIKNKDNRDVDTPPLFLKISISTRRGENGGT